MTAVHEPGDELFEVLEGPARVALTPGRAHRSERIERTDTRLDLAGGHEAVE